MPDAALAVSIVGPTNDPAATNVNTSNRMMLRIVRIRFDFPILSIMLLPFLCDWFFQLVRIVAPLPLIK